MNLVVTKERRFVKGPDNRIYTDNEQASGYSVLRRYLDVFDSLTVVGRLREESVEGLTAVTGPGIDFVPVPDYLGPRDYFWKKKAIRTIFRDLVEDRRGASCFIARCPGTMAAELTDQLRWRSYPFGLEVVGDPYDVFAPGAIRHPLRPLFRWKFPRELQSVCLSAAAVSYVTEYQLQRRYPASPGVFTTHYSSIHLNDSDFIESSREFQQKEHYQLVFVGTMAQLYKAPDVLINAVAKCLQRGFNIELRMVGDGMFRRQLEKMAECCGEKVRFLGRLPAGDAVREELDRADLFVLPSKGEGLPRAMIEAMARGLPCIGTTASGIPELLPEEDLVAPGDSDALARKIMEVLSDPARMTRMSGRNLQKSADYLVDKLRKRRIEFYHEVLQQTETFLKAQTQEAGVR